MDRSGWILGEVWRESSYNFVVGWVLGGRGMEELRMI